jgi:hypothetical protein
VGANYPLDGVPSSAAAKWAAGWYADPWGKAPQRYWEGAEWTGYTG